MVAKLPVRGENAQRYGLRRESHEERQMPQPRRHVRRAETLRLVRSAAIREWRARRGQYRFVPAFAFSVARCWHQQPASHQACLLDRSSRILLRRSTPEMLSSLSRYSQSRLSSVEGFRTSTSRQEPSPMSQKPISELRRRMLDDLADRDVAD